MTKALPPADHVNAAEEAAHPFALGRGAELGPAPAATLEHREAETLVLEQRLPVAHQRRHDRDLRRGELEREAMLFLDRRVASSDRDDRTSRSAASPSSMPTW